MGKAQAGGKVFRDQKKTSSEQVPRQPPASFLPSHRTGQGCHGSCAQRPTHNLPRGFFLSLHVGAGGNNRGFILCRSPLLCLFMLACQSSQSPPAPPFCLSVLARSLRAADTNRTISNAASPLRLSPCQADAAVFLTLMILRCR